MAQRPVNGANHQHGQVGCFEHYLSGDGDPAHAPARWSDEIFRILGYEPGAIPPYRETFLKMLHPEDREYSERAVAQALRDKQPFAADYRLTRRDGSERTVHSEVQILCDADTGKPIRMVGTIRDVTERKRTEERMFLLGQAVEHTRELIVVGDVEGRAIFANRAILELLGYFEEELLGQPIRKTIHSPNNRPGLDEELQAALQEKHVWKGECLYRRKDGSDFRVYLRLSPLIDDTGERMGAMGISQDITEQRSLEEQLRQAQKMEAVGRLSGGIAHDFNNILGVIIGHSELIESVTGDPKKFRRHLSEIRKAAERAASLTRQLLAFSRQQILELRPLNLNAVVVDIEKMLQRLIGEDIEMRTALEPRLGNVKADQGQVGQIIMNLAVNARDAMPNGGKLLIETANIEADETFARQHGFITPGSFVMLAVTDTGCGMDAETQSHIFEPFFTTKARGKGTGLGLATVYGVVKQSNGFIWVYSEPGHGTIFKILLPRIMQNAAQPAARERESRLPSRASETILLVEDDTSLRELTAQVLSEQGYTVLEAANGSEALAVARKDPAAHIHLLLTDVVMPGMSGPEVANALTLIRPGIRVLFMSGYTEFAAGHDQISSPGQFLIRKPFTRTDLARTLREVLETAPQPAPAGAGD